MTNIFMNLLQFSIQAGVLVLALVVLRLILRKTPRCIICALWALVAVRLVFPFRIESIFSLVPPTDTLTIVSESVNRGITQQIAAPLHATIINAPVSGDPVFIRSAPISAYQIAMYIWIVGMIGMLIYALVSWLRLYRLTRECVKEDKNIYLCDRVQSPFILGIFRPRIILPFNISEKDKPYVLAHEKAHLKRRDHLWKPLGFLLLSVYWFNPLLWLAYILLCRDIEMACDEKVLRELGSESKKPYAMALVNAAAPRRMIAACPLAFGETGVKPRIKNILNYKKPAFWVIVTAIVLSIVIAVCFLTNPVSKKNTDTATPYNADAPVSASYIWSSYEESTSPQYGYAYVNLRVSNYSNQDIAVNLSDYRLYKNDSLLTPSYGDDLLYYDFFDAGTSDTNRFSLYPYLSEIDTRSTFRIEADYYSFEETDASDIDGEYAPNVGKEPLGSIAINFRFLSKEERGDVPDFLDDIQYHDIDGDGKEEMITVSNGPTSGVSSFYIGAYDKETHRLKYHSALISHLSYEETMKFEKDNNRLLMSVTEYDYSSSEGSFRNVVYLIHAVDNRVTLTEVSQDENDSSSYTDDDRSEIIAYHAGIPFLEYIDENFAYFGSGGSLFDGGDLIIYDLANEKITDWLTSDQLLELGYDRPYIRASADGKEIYLFDAVDTNRTHYMVFSPEIHDFITPSIKGNLGEIKWFEFDDNHYSNQSTDEVFVWTCRKGDNTYNLTTVLQGEHKGTTLTAYAAGTEKTYRILA